MNTPLWSPSAEGKRAANMTAFIEHVNRSFGLALAGYDELYDWSIEAIPDFWAAVWDFTGVIASRPYEVVVDDLSRMPGARWFVGAQLNFAENLLRYRDDRTALVFHGEGGAVRRLSYAQLYDEVSRLARALRDEGIVAGDRVAGFMPNVIETVVAMLATVSIGAVWSSCSPDFGIQGVLDRFGQIEPKLLFTADGYFYNGRAFDSLERIGGIIEKLPSVRKVVVVPYTAPVPDTSRLAGAVRYQGFLAPQAEEIDFAQLPPDHPLYIMYSSGTTGVPKCMVHSAAGTLLQHLKELVLHVDLKREDRIFYFTTCGWMMWNWLVSALAVGSTVLLFDGSPFHPDPSTLFGLAEQEGMTVFGTSARYIAAVEKSGLVPGKSHDLAALRAVLSTGSPLAPESFHHVYRDWKSDVCLSSISGGTDLISCFALGCPLLPVFAGELQCPGLGMKIAAYDQDGEPLVGTQGELVCRAPFPSMPVSFWNDPDGAKYRAAYFERFPGIWHHGDFVEITEQRGVIIYGRSDATLNPGGVRIGTAEIYRQVETFPEVADSIVVAQEWEGDQRLILFVKLALGVQLSEELVRRIKSTIRTNTTPRHVPAKILAVADIPYTISGKKVELAVRKVIHGQKVENRDALGNPQALDLYKDLEELRR